MVRLAERGRALLDRPGPYRLLKEGIGKTSVTDRRLYITDGGHYDNLGLVEALRRRPATIIVLDASNDSENSFRALGEAVATARMDLDCEIEIDPAPMITTDGVAKIAWVDGKLTYSDGATATVHFAKAVKLDGTAAGHPGLRRAASGVPADRVPVTSSTASSTSRRTVSSAGRRPPGCWRGCRPPVRMVRGRPRGRHRAHAPPGASTPGSQARQ